MRLFFAVELPSEVQAALGRLRPKDESRDYRWVDTSLLHVTLVFLGEQSDEQLQTLKQIGASAASASRTATLGLGRAGSFGPKRAPRVLWVDLAGDIDALNHLQSRLAEGLRQNGFAVEERPFRAHITLARRRETAHGGAPVEWPPERIAAKPFALSQLTLMQSRLSPRGPTYTPLLVFPLGGGIVAPTTQQR